MIDTNLIDVGVMVWTKGRNEYADGASGGLVVDVGVDDKGEYVIVIDGSPTHAPTSPKRRTWVYSRTEGRMRHEDLGQVAELRRHYLADLAPTDGFRNAHTMHAFAARAMLAAGVRAQRGDESEEMTQAARVLITAAAEMRAAS